MNTIMIMPTLQAISETFIMHHVEILHGKKRLLFIVVTSIKEDFKWQNVPVYSLGKRCLRPRYDRIWRSLLRHLGINFSSWYPLNRIMKLLIQQADVDFDNVLIEYGDTAYYLYESVKEWLQSNKRVLIHLHGYDAVANSFPKDYAQRLRELAELGAIFISNSHYTTSTITSWSLPPQHLVVKYYGIVIPDKICRHYDGDTITVLHLGRLVDFKGPHLTIRAFEIACELGLKGNLIIAGDGEMRDECKMLWQESPWKDRIALIGAVEWNKAKELRQEADIFTLHSVVGEKSGRVENFGVAIVEAMAAELPVVTCAIGGIKETVINGETGIFFPSGDIEAQAKAFLNLAENPELRRKLGEAGRKHVIDNFSIEREKAELQRLLLGEIAF